MTDVREASVPELRSWDAELTRLANWRVVHTRGWVQSLEASGYGQPLHLVFARGGEIVGYLPGLLVHLGPIRVFGSSLPGWQTVSMGPAYDPDRLSTEEMFRVAVPFLERRYAVDHIEILSSSLDGDAMAALGFRGQVVPTFLAPLRPGDEAGMLRGLKDSARRNIRRAVRLGLHIRFEEEEAFVDEHYDQLKEVYVHGGNVLNFRKRRALEFFRHMKAAGRLVAVSVRLPDGDVPIATGMFTIAGGELLLWSWAHRIRYRWYRPTELMTWTVMVRAAAAGCETFDLMGRGDFKAKFGAELDETKRRWVRSRYRWLTDARDLVERGGHWGQSMLGRLARLRAPRGEPPVVAGGSVGR
jgi:hypothetical protein